MVICEALPSPNLDQAAEGSFEPAAISDDSLETAETAYRGGGWNHGGGGYYHGGGGYRRGGYHHGWHGK